MENPPRLKPPPREDRVTVPAERPPRPKPPARTVPAWRRWKLAEERSWLRERGGCLLNLRPYWLVGVPPVRVRMAEEEEARAEE
ncbi:MAG: hypothetical protein IIA14_14915 [SAR324 cluster bacterium]|nr:hypothetical protein [SAR324 cluster bacterium]